MATAGHFGQSRAKLLKDLTPLPNCRRKPRGASCHEWESSSSSPPTARKTRISATYASLLVVLEIVSLATSGH